MRIEEGNIFFSWKRRRLGYLRLGRRYILMPQPCTTSNAAGSSGDGSVVCGFTAFPKISFLPHRHSTQMIFTIYILPLDDSYKVQVSPFIWHVSPSYRMGEAIRMLHVIIKLGEGEPRKRIFFKNVHKQSLYKAAVNFEC